MALSDKLKRGRLNRFLAASAVFVSGAFASNTASAAEEKPQNATVQKQTSPIPSLSGLQNFIQQIDTLCKKSVVEKLNVHEGNISHLYLDSRGILTTGVGLNVNDYKSFSQLDFKDSNGNLFTEKQKKSYFAQIKAFQQKQAKKGFNFKASVYASSFRFNPTSESLEKMLIARVENSLKESKEKVGKTAYYNLHVEAQTQIVMMMYNMGSARFNDKKFPSFFKAARSLDYATMAKECHVKGISEKRNQEIATAFTNAGQKRWILAGTYLEYYQNQTTQIAMNSPQATRR